MRRRLAWLGGALGVATLVRTLRRRRAAVSEPAERTDPADELRSALAETREAETPPEAAAEPAPAAEEPRSLEERRRRVHEQAQQAIDAMREPEP
jgi:hypothetical protein